jgi:cytoskeletal protein RodZ
MKTSRAERESYSDGFDISRVGAWLKIAREEKCETIDEVAKITRIGKNYLEAIEEGAAAKLPNQAYTKGFIRLYASHLGLSPEEAITMMEVRKAEINPELQSNPQVTRKRLPAYSRNLMIATLALALVSGYILLKPTQSSRVGIAPSAQATKSLVNVQEQSAPPTPPPPSPSPALPKNSDNQGIVLRLKSISDGKIHITIDGSVSQEYDLVAGDLVEWKAETAFVLDLDNAASVEAELDGVKLNPFGEQGKAAHLVLKADGIHKE